MYIMYGILTHLTLHYLDMYNARGPIFSNISKFLYKVIQSKEITGVWYH